MKTWCLVCFVCLFFLKSSYFLYYLPSAMGRFSTTVLQEVTEFLLSAQIRVSTHQQIFQGTIYWHPFLVSANTNTSPRPHLPQQGVPPTACSLPVSSKDSWGFISCSARSATTAAAASGGGWGGDGGALTGVVDSGVSNASSESELLGKTKQERVFLTAWTSKEREDSWQRHQLLGYLCDLQRQPTRRYYTPVWFPEQNIMATILSLLCATKVNVYLETNPRCRACFSV